MKDNFALVVGVEKPFPRCNRSLGDHIIRQMYHGVKSYLSFPNLAQVGYSEHRTGPIEFNRLRQESHMLVAKLYNDLYTCKIRTVFHYDKKMGFYF